MDNNKQSGRNLTLLLVAVVSVIILIVCVIMLSVYSISSYKQSLEASSLKGMIGESKVSLTTDLATGKPAAVAEVPDAVSSDGSKTVMDKYRSLYELNNDLVGWISIEDTRIDYPVMQTIYDEEYYLHRNYEREDSNEGLPFMDSRCIIGLPSTNLIIYGHNMKNGDMFADLLKYEKKSYYENHRYIRFDTIYEEALYEIIAVFRTRVAYRDEDTFRFYNFIEADSTEDFYDYLDNIRALSLYDIQADAKSSDYLLTLSTCEYTVEDGRFVVVARRIANVDD